MVNAESLSRVSQERDGDDRGRKLSLTRPERAPGYSEVRPAGEIPLACLSNKLPC